MSLDASRWAWKQRVGKSSAKLVLLSLADLADEQNRSWPSIKHLELDTELNRKTIIDSLGHLERHGFLIDTGDRKGRTGQVKVYQLIGVQRRHYPSRSNSPKSGTLIARQKNEAPEAPPYVGSADDIPADISKSPEINTLQNLPPKPPLKESLNRNYSVFGTVPLLRGKSTDFTSKESQKRDTDPTNEPISEPLSSQHQQRASCDDEFAMTLDWLPDANRFAEVMDLREVDPSMFSLAALNDFRTYWVGRADVFPEKLWEHKLAGSLIEFEAKRQRRECGHVMLSGFGEAFARRELAGGALDS